MGREVKRVPLDFVWEIDIIWWGYLMPESLQESTCGTCGGSGYSAGGRRLRDEWYGLAPFDPASTGSTPYTVDTPAIRVRAERNVNQSPEYYGPGEGAVLREALRLADLFNTQWSHHLAQDDVDALIAAERLRDFTHERKAATGAREPIKPAPQVAAGRVNLWSLNGLGHDSINCMIAVEEKARRLGIVAECAECGGRGSTEKHAGQRSAAEAWIRTEPPTGDGWQLWSTTTEGHPMTPVFATAEDLARHCANSRVSWFGDARASYDEWLSSFGGEGIIGSVTVAPGVVVL